MFLRIVFIAEVVMAAAYAIINVSVNSFAASLVLKTICSAGFVVTGFLSYQSLKKSEWSRYSKSIMLGQFLSFIGDILLQIGNIDSITFVLGLLCFVSAHFSFIVALCIKTKVEPVNVIVAFLMESAFIICSLTLPAFDFHGVLPVIAFYGIIVLFLLGKSLSYFRFRNSNPKFAFLTMMGCLFIFIGDFIIMFVLFIPTSPRNFLSVMNLICYYTGHECLSFSLSCPETAAELS